MDKLIRYLNIGNSKGEAKSWLTNIQANHRSGRLIKPNSLSRQVNMSRELYDKLTVFYRPYNEFLWREDDSSILRKLVPEMSVGDRRAVFHAWNER